MDNSGIERGNFQVAGTWFKEVFDRSTLGIIHADPFGHILYANPKAHEISGFPDLTKVGLRDLFPDQGNYEVVQHHLAERRKGQEDEYDIEITSRSGNKVPIRVSSMPILSGGEVTGAVSILRSTEVESASLALHEAISSASSLRSLLNRVSRCIRDVLPCDLLRVSRYSTDTRHSRMIFQYPETADQPAIRWIPLSDSVQQIVQQSRPSRHSLSEFAAQPGVKALMDQGLQWSMRYPVRRQGRMAGSISMYRRSEEFSEREFEIFKALPLDSALAAALFFESRTELQFTFRLVKAIGRCRNEYQIFRLLTRAFVVHRGWSVVSVFTPDEISGEMILRSHTARRPEHRLEAGYRQPLNEGLLGYVYRNGEDVCVSDVATNPQFGRIIIRTPGLAEGSELCMRICAEGRIYALLNVEEAQVNGFSDEERAELRELLDQLGEVIQRRRRDSLITAAFNATPTAIFLVDDKGIIRDSNPTAPALLGRSPAELVGRSIAEFIENKDVASAIAEVQRPVGEIDLISATKERIHGILAGLPLEGTFGLRMLTFRDTRVQQRVEQLDALTQVYLEMARQVKPDLAIVGACLRELSELASQPATGSFRAALLGQASRIVGLIPELVNGILQNLHHLESTFDRVTLLGAADGPPEPHLRTIYVRRLVEDVVMEIPRTDPDAIKVKISSEQYIAADPGQLALILQTVLSYLLRFRRRTTPVTLDVDDSGAHVNFVLTGACPDFSQDKYEGPKDLEIARAVQDLSLGKPYLRRMIEKHHGVFEEPVIKDGSFRMQFALPGSGGNLL